MHDRYGPRVASRLIVGLSIALVGLLLLFDEMGVLRARHILRYWPVLLVIIGLARILSPWSGHSRFFGFLLVVFGGWLLLDRLGYVYFEWQYFWPALLVLFGLRLALAGSVFRGRRWQRPRRGSAAAEDAPGGPTGAFASADAEIDALAVLGSVVRASTAQGFNGGNAIAVLGSCRIDLRRATLDGEALIEVLAILGGVTILVPEGWSVVLNGLPILGGFEDKTKPPIGGSTQRLVVRGIAIMGGVEVKNKREIE